ncbi:MAG: enolase C-terminal domain-like protein, partial [Phycisphaeraceae bacterium]
RFHMPLVLSSGTIDAITEARITVTVRVGDREATGRGSIYLSDLWAWPDPALAHEQRDAILRRRCERIASALDQLCGGEAAHPLELGLRLHHNVCEAQPRQTNDPPALALSMCLSPFDAAIHDAVGHALDRSAFALYDNAGAIPSVDALFDGGAAGAVRRMLRPKPLRELPAWLIVGKNDDLTEQVAPWVRQRGYRCFKLKLMGQDNAVDVQRTVEVYRAVREFGAASAQLSVDTNEANPDAASVLDYLERLEAADGQAYEALAFLEQPTGRDITVHAHDWRAVGARKPVLLDEGLTSLALLDEAARQGWSGLALKTCKGHSFALAAAAWAHARGLSLSMQDLTNPGYSAIHSALFAGHVPTINGVELNSPQFTPDANRDWLPRLAGLFEPTDGIHRLPTATPRGLGSTL